VRTPGDYHTFIVRPAQSSHENNEETQNLNQGNTNENEGPSKSSSICGICIVFFLFFLSIMIMADYASNTEPVVYTTTQPPDPDFHNNPAYKTVIKTSIEAREMIQKMILAYNSTTIVTPVTKSLKPTDRWDSYAKKTSTTKRPRRTNGLRAEHNDIEDEHSVDMDENLSLTLTSNSTKDTSPTIATQTTMKPKFRWPFVWDPDDRVFRFRTVNYNFEDEN